MRTSDPEFLSRHGEQSEAIQTKATPNNYRFMFGLRGAML